MKPVNHDHVHTEHRADVAGSVLRAVQKVAVKVCHAGYWHFGYGYFSQEPGCH
jgi:hypothetical protein